MKRRYTFDGTQLGSVRYTLFLNAVLTRGSARPEKHFTPLEMDSDGRILDAAFAIGVPDPKAPEPEWGQPDNRMRILRKSGGTITLESSDYLRALGYIKETQWMAISASAAQDLRDSFEADAEKINEGEKNNDGDEDVRAPARGADDRSPKKKRD